MLKSKQSEEIQLDFYRRRIGNFIKLNFAALSFSTYASNPVLFITSCACSFLPSHASISTRKIHYVTSKNAEMKTNQEVTENLLSLREL